MKKTLVFIRNIISYYLSKRKKCFCVCVCVFLAKSFPDLNRASTKRVSSSIVFQKGVIADIENAHLKTNQSHKNKTLAGTRISDKFCL